MTPRYVLTEAAEADLRDIIRYTRAQWGDEQVRDYVAKLTRGFDRVSQGHGKDMSALYPKLQTLHCDHHYIFCLPRDDGPALIVAILHERMDLLARLRHRLT